MSDHRTRAQALQAKQNIGDSSENTTTVQFIDGLIPENERPKRPPKLHHKKSKTGCQRCRVRRVKCNEARPVCGNCERHLVPCIYDRDRRRIQSLPPITRQNRAEPSPSAVSPDTSSLDTESTDIAEPAESSKRRLLELGLLHHYNTETSQTLLVSGDPIAREVWLRNIPIKALENAALLYSVYALSALHMAEVDPHSYYKNMDTHRTYLDMAIREHQNDLQNINEKNADAVCMTSALLRTNASAMLRDRSLEPYSPPVLWMEMTRGAMSVFEQAWDWIKDDQNSLARRLTSRMPIVFDAEIKFAASNREDFSYLLVRKEEDIATEPWDQDIQEVYESTISYVGCIWIAIQQHVSPGEICRRLLLFPYFIQGRFIDLVKEERPRALAVLAHFFVLLTRFRSVWWVGEAGPREFHALETLLSGTRQELLSWPLGFFNEEDILQT